MMNGSSGQATNSSVIIGCDTVVCAVSSGNGTAVEIIGSSHGAATPPSTQQIANATTLTPIRIGAQLAFSASFVRGAPRNVTP
ncbi:Uncharacterised protein [Salmonella enterica subsp. enterica serovar Bovismorbificans]|nr:Uncharacterised protein [Salmonella enterica subsp. enterica serovar Bovismorbificans]